MKKSLRFASAALALTLAAGCAMPAFAAGKSSFSKSETVYAVMNGDGSIKSTTVSEHLYSASGLANVTDKTTLTDIQNTESDAEFTQNGEELVWNTNDTDVYYKGNTDKALPIDVKVTYALDGQEAALEDIIGKSGHLTVTVNLKNNETGTVNVNGKDPHHRHSADHRCGRHSGRGCFQRDRRTRYDRKRRQKQRCRLCHPAGREGFPVRLAAR